MYIYILMRVIRASFLNVHSLLNMELQIRSHLRGADRFGVYFLLDDVQVSNPLKL